MWPLCGLSFCSSFFSYFITSSNRQPCISEKTYYISNFSSLQSPILLLIRMMCNACFCLFALVWRDRKLWLLSFSGFLSFFFFFVFYLVFPWPREGAHVAKTFVLPYIYFFSLNTTVLLHCFLLTLSFCAFQFICLHPAFASDTVGTEFWAREKQQQRDVYFFPFYSLAFCLLGDGSPFFCFSPCLA